MFLPNLIHQDQTGFLKGRYIGENVRLILDIMEHAKLAKRPGYIMFVDFEKAFNYVNFRFIVTNLEIFGFGSEFIN